MRAGKPDNSACALSEQTSREPEVRVRRMQRRRRAQPLAGLPGRLRGGGVGAGRCALPHGLRAAAGAAKNQAIRTPEGEALSGAGIVIEAGGRDGRADVLPLRVPALPGDLTAADPWRQGHAAAGVQGLRAAEEDCGSDVNCTWDAVWSM